ncbi:MAG: hypothetical protein A2846_01945 [Candidatus Doudnabacteria bacterium RIFCSPHIGHO2_01_FULL_49_9]|uniref:DNA replication and repair protein RecF n=1 Tax=Candidatus Doudnabacteria bacterium RIFCSPHIGHO2_01_FULL_49_9 TaxID=1817827 RepID=A0A1F5P3B3_9BACT|nr:MAG: hypothetical protein A2846_01945 [Candidatus Doudnabacteria bacterium RIFCSPHIGHO2_01_FULL_49_9]
MYIKKANFQNFRNFSKLDLTFRPGFVILSGPNGAGKTNFLEGLYFSLSLARFPTSALSQLLRGKEQFFSIKTTTLSNEDISFEIFCEQREGRPFLQLKTNGQVVTRGQYARHASVICFLPEDLNLLTHSPANRRRFLDEVLVSCSPEYRHTLSQYTKTLKQRSVALEKQATLEVWDEQLANFGSVITGFRKNLAEFINKRLEDVLSNISSELGKIELKYHAGGDSDKDNFGKKLALARARDLQRLTTSVGPHHDDFEMFNERRAIVGYLSRGQLRAITLALKILEKQYLESFGLSPLMLLDDVFSEFDTKHQRHLLEFLKGFEQVFLTTAHLEEIKEFLPAGAQVYIVSDGSISSLPRPGEG